MVILAVVFGPVLGAFAMLWIAGRSHEENRKYSVLENCAVIIAAAVFLLTLFLPVRLPSARIPGILSEGLTFSADGFRSAYAVIASFMWLMTSLFSPEYFSGEREHLERYWFFILVTLGATEGVMLSADLMTAFLFFEILSFTSFTWVIHEETPEAIRAGYTYLFIAVIGGLVLFMGLLLMKQGAGSLSFDGLSEIFSAAGGAGLAADNSSGAVMAAGVCILLGFGAKAGMFPLHIWLPKAHPVAPSPASALLSGILTKVGIYGILMTVLCVFPACTPYGILILAAGSVTMLLGAVLALFSVSLKRTLAASSMSQIGFILTGTGMTILLRAAAEEEAARMTLGGVMLHMVSHSLIKLVLFMAAGAVVMHLHTQDLNVLRGWGRRKPLLKAAFALGGLGISGVPLFNGYISKTLLHEGIVEGIHGIRHLASGTEGMLSLAYGQTGLQVLEWIFLFSGGLTFAYMLKLFICIFCEKNTDPARQESYDRQTDYMNRVSAAAIFGPALLMPVLGQPAAANRLAAWMTGFSDSLSFRAFTAENLKGSAISLLIGALVYLLFVRKCILKDGRYRDLWPKNLDLEELVYRPVLTMFLPGLFGRIAAVFGENRILRPLCHALFTAASALAGAFGENKVLKPVCRMGLSAAAVLARTLSDSLDMVILMLRKSVLREKKSRQPENSRSRRFRVATEFNLSSVLDGFSFALIMTCIGIIIILGTLLWLTLNPFMR